MVISLKSTESWSSRSNRSKTPVHTVQPVHGPITERPALGYSVQPVHWTGSPAGCILHWSERLIRRTPGWVEVNPDHARIFPNFEAVRVT